MTRYGFDAAAATPRRKPPAAVEAPPPKPQLPLHGLGQLPPAPGAAAKLPPRPGVPAEVDMQGAYEAFVVDLSSCSSMSHMRALMNTASGGNPGLAQALCKRLHSPRRRASFGPNGLLVAPIRVNEISITKVPNPVSPKALDGLMTIHVESLDLETAISNLAKNDEGGVWGLVDAIWGGSSPSTASTKRARPSSLPSAESRGVARQSEADAHALEKVDHWLRVATGGLIWGEGETLAVKAAESGDVRFATIVAQIPGMDTRARALLQQQLAVWKEQHTPVADAYVKLFALIGGDSMQHQQEQKSWLNALALQVWFSNGAMQPLRAVLRDFEKSVARKSAPKPASVFSSGAIDTRYRVLELAANPRTFELVNVLAPLGMTKSSWNSSMPWMLWQVLDAIGVFGNGLSKRQSHLLTMGLVSQLEAAGCHYWAVYVARLLRDPRCNAHAVRALVCRHAPDFSQDEVSRLRSIGVSRELMELGLAHAAKYDRDIKKEVEHLMLAREWKLWTETMGRTLGPLLVVNGELDKLTELVRNAQTLGFSLPDADLGPLRVLLDYCETRRAAEELTKKSPVDALDDVQSLEAMVRGLLTQMRGRPSSSPSNVQVASWAALRWIELARISRVDPWQELPLDLPLSSDFAKRLAAM